VENKGFASLAFKGKGGKVKGKVEHDDDAALSNA